MLRPAELKSVVRNTLAKPTISDPHKTYAEAMIDGTITKADLSAINTAITFPTNDYNQLKLPEGRYNSMEAMNEFISAILPYLSDEKLYKITHILAEIEVGGLELASTDAFRNSTLAKYFIKEEIKRHGQQMSTESFPKVFLSHLKDYILPLCQKYWATTGIDQAIKTFIDFNFKLDSTGVMEALGNFESLNVAELGTQASESADKFLNELKQSGKKAGRASSSGAPVITKPSDFKKIGTSQGKLFNKEAKKMAETLTQQLQSSLVKSESNESLIEDCEKRLLKLKDDKSTSDKLPDNDNTAEISACTTLLRKTKLAQEELQSKIKTIKLSLDTITSKLDVKPKQRGGM